MVSEKYKIDVVFAFGFINSELIILSVQKNDKVKTIIVEDPKLGNYSIKTNDRSLFYQKLNSHIVEVTLYDKFTYDDDFAYLSSGYFNKNLLIIANRRTKTFYEIGNKNNNNLGFYVKKNLVINNEDFIDITNNLTAISLYKIHDLKSILKWQTDISSYGELRLNRHGEIQPKETSNTVNGELIGYEDTVVVPLAGGQLLGLNIADGSLKWIREFEKRQDFISQNNESVYVYNRERIWEIKIQSGEISRELEIKRLFVDTMNDWPNHSKVSGGKLIIDFLKTDSSLLVIDLVTFDLETAIQVHADAFLKARFNDVIWHDNQLYARDPLSNTLYIFGDATV